MHTKEKEKLFNENKALIEFLKSQNVHFTEFSGGFKQSTYYGLRNPKVYHRHSLSALERLNKHLVTLRDNLKPPVFTKKAISDTSALMHTIISAYGDLLNMGWSSDRIDRALHFCEGQFRQLDNGRTMLFGHKLKEYIMSGGYRIPTATLEDIAKDARRILQEAREEHESTMIPHGEHKRVTDDLKAKIRGDWVIIGLLALMIPLVGYICITFF